MVELIGMRIPTIVVAVEPERRQRSETQGGKFVAEGLGTIQRGQHERPWSPPLESSQNGRGFPLGTVRDKPKVPQQGRVPTALNLFFFFSNSLIEI